MKKYVNIYSFQVLEKAEQGKQVFCIDKEYGIVTEVQKTPLGIVLKTIKECDKAESNGRFEFYYVEEVKECAENDNV